MFRRLLCIWITISFTATLIIPSQKANAQGVLGLPEPGNMVSLSSAYEPVMIKGLTVHKDNPFLFDFIVDIGQDKMSGDPLKQEGQKLIKYFLASLAIPDKDVWVNLSPYEKDRMIPEVLGQTEMGRDLLAQDYILKQITASLIYPESQLGKSFWNKVYAKAQAMYGTTEIPVNTFNKVWIMADKAEVFERNQTAFVVGQHLKVMLEEDYLALNKQLPTRGHLPGAEGERQVSPSTLPSDQALNVKATQGNNGTTNETHSIGTQIVREIVLPELEKEINTGKNFANLRQIFNSIILSSRYKKNLKQALLNQVYADQGKVKGIDLSDPTIKQQIYEQYLKAYKKGVFNYIKEDPSTQPDGLRSGQATIPRKYFSGGMDPGMAANPAMTYDPAVLAKAIPDSAQLVDFATAAVPFSKKEVNAAMIIKYESFINKIVPLLKDWRPKNYPPGVVPHLDSHQALINELKEEGLLTDFDAQLMRTFVEFHDSGYALDLKNKDNLDRLKNIWYKIGIILTNDEEKSRDIAKKIREMIEFYSDFPAVVKWKMEQLKENPAYKETPEEDLKKMALALAGKESYMVTRVIAHGTTSILSTMKKLQEEGLSEDEAFGMALMFAAHHTGYPITMVHQFVITGVIPEELVPVLLITDGPSAESVNRDESLRQKIADEAARLMKISPLEARYYATLGYALDRITPARMMTTFSMNNFVLHEDGSYDGQILWGGPGETIKKYPLIVTNTKDPMRFTVGDIFRLSIGNMTKEAEAAIKAQELMTMGLSGDAQERSQKLGNLIKKRSAYEIHRTEQMHEQILKMLSEKLPEFSGDLRDIDTLIRQAIDLYSKTKQDDSVRLQVEYLLGFLITIKTSQLAQDHIKSVTIAGKRTQGIEEQVLNVLKESLLGTYFDADTLPALLKSPGVEIERFKAGDVIFDEGSAGKEMFLILDGEIEYFSNGNSIGSAKAGEFFGEIAALTGTQRRASVRSKTSTTLLRISESDSRKLIRENPYPFLELLRSRRIDETILKKISAELLKSLDVSALMNLHRGDKPAFHGMNSFELEKIAKVAKLRKQPLKEGETFIQQGQSMQDIPEDAPLLYFVRRGKVSIDRGDGKPIELKVNGGDTIIMGEMIFFTGQRTASVKAISDDVEIYEISKKDALVLMNEIPHLISSLSGLTLSRSDEKPIDEEDMPRFRTALSSVGEVEKRLIPIASLSGKTMEEIKETLNPYVRKLIQVYASSTTNDDERKRMFYTISVLIQRALKNLKDWDKGDVNDLIASIILQAWKEYKDRTYFTNNKIDQQVRELFQTLIDFPVVGDAESNGAEQQIERWRSHVKNTNLDQVWLSLWKFPRYRFAVDAAMVSEASNLPQEVIVGFGLRENKRWFLGSSFPQNNIKKAITVGAKVSEEEFRRLNIKDNEPIARARQKIRRFLAIGADKQVFFKDSEGQEIKGDQLPIFVVLHLLQMDDGSVLVIVPDRAMIKEKELTLKNAFPGGIDLATSGMQWKVSKNGQGVEMSIDPAIIERVKREGIQSLSPVILNITPIVSIWPLIGLKDPSEEEKIAKV